MWCGSGSGLGWHWLLHVCRVALFLEIDRCVCVCVLFGLLKRERGGGEERGERESARVGRRLSASSANGQPSIHACSV